MILWCLLRTCVLVFSVYQYMYERKNEREIHWDPDVRVVSQVVFPQELYDMRVCHRRGLVETDTVPCVWDHIRLERTRIGDHKLHRVELTCQVDAISGRRVAVAISLAKNSVTLTYRTTRVPFIAARRMKRDEILPVTTRSGRV